MKKVTDTQQEWSYPVEADSIGADVLTLRISPNAQEAAALARRYDIVKIKDLVADLKIRRNQGNMVIYVQGKFSAQIEQKCVISLVPLEQVVEGDFEGWYADPDQAVSFTKAKRERMSIKEKGEQPMLDESEDPEPIVDGTIDVGELVAQHVSLVIDPYPRAPDAKFEGAKIGDMGAEPEGVYDNPFAALKEWRTKENKDSH